MFKAYEIHFSVSNQSVLSKVYNSAVTMLSDYPIPKIEGFYKKDTIDEINNLELQYEFS